MRAALKHKNIADEYQVEIGFGCVHVMNTFRICIRYSEYGPAHMLAHKCMMVIFRPRKRYGGLGRSQGELERNLVGSSSL